MVYTLTIYIYIYHGVHQNVPLMLLAVGYGNINIFFNLICCFNSIFTSDRGKNTTFIKKKKKT